MTPPSTPQTGDLLYSEIEDDLRASVRALLEKRSAWDAVLARTETDETTDHDLWVALATEVGCASLPVPEDRGGAGASWRESAVVSEELGRAAAPVPFLGSAVVGTAVLLAPGVDADDLLPAVAEGELTVALAVPAATGPGGVVPQLERTAAGGIRGRVPGVLDAAHADVLLVPADDALYLVEAGVDEVRLTPVVSLDMTRPLTDLELIDAPGRLLAGTEVAGDAWAHGLRVGAAILASEQLGLAERCLEMTVEYLAVRRQFGRVLGSYQALKHRLADLWVDISQARAVARHAAVCAAEGDDDLPVAAALAQAHCAEVALHVAEECVQLHGGIGFTWEHPAHLYLKRARSSVAVLGTPERHRALLGDLIDLPAVGA
jgi:alkylation response protein AidB-like acyl-CoA dehydrogenase